MYSLTEKVMIFKKVHSHDIIIRHLGMSPFKSTYFQFYYKIVCRKTIEATIMKKVPNKSKLI